MVLPREWTSCTIKDIQSVEVQNGFSPQCVEYETARKSLSLGALTGFSLDLTQEKFISEKAELPLNSMLHKNDILVSRSNTKDKVGRAAVVLEDVVEYYYPDLMMRFQVDSQKADCRYVAMYLQSPMGRNYFMSHAAGTSTSMVKINKNVLESFPMVLPPLAEQKKIAETLSVWDSAIEKMETLIGAKQGCFNNLLNELIYSPAKDGKWKLAKLGEISEMGSGGTPKSFVEEYYNGDILWVSIADMTEQGMYISDTAKKLTKAGIENSSAEIYPAGTVLYAMYASIGEVSIASVDMSSSQAILGIQVGKNLRNKYLYYFLVGQKDHIKLQGQSGTQSNLNAGMVRNFDIPLPSLNKQDEIVDFLDSNMRELSLLKQQLALYKKQKQGLVQKLLTGEWRVK